MNDITRALWDRDLNVQKWSAINGFNPRYVYAVTAGRRGSLNAGTAKKIMKALKDQGFIKNQDGEQK